VQRDSRFYAYEDLSKKVMSVIAFENYVLLLMEILNERLMLVNLVLLEEGQEPVELLNLEHEAFGEYQELCQDLRKLLSNLVWL